MTTKQYTKTLLLFFLFFIFSFSAVGSDKWLKTYVKEKKRYYIVTGIAVNQRSKPLAKEAAIKYAEQNLLIYLDDEDKKSYKNKRIFEHRNFKLKKKKYPNYRIHNKKIKTLDYRKKTVKNFGLKETTYDFFVKLKIRKKHIETIEKYKLMLKSNNSELMAILNRYLVEDNFSLVSKPNDAQTKITIDYSITTNVVQDTYKCIVTAKLDVENDKKGNFKLTFDEFGYGQEKKIAIDNASKNLATLISKDLRGVIK